MATTPEQVVQMALAHLGQTETVSSITSPSTKGEILGALFYPRVRDRLLTKHNWSWATRRAALTDVTSTEGRSGWSYAFTLPTDLLRVIGIDLGYRSGPEPAGFNPLDPTLPSAPWAMEMNSAGTGKVLLTDVAAATVVYTASITSLDLWRPDAIEALTFMLAARLAMPLTVKADLMQLAETAARKYLDEAIASDANEARPDPVQTATSQIIAARAW